MVREGAASRYESASLRAAGVALLGDILLVWSGIVAIRAAGQGKARRREAGTLLIEGQTIRQIKR
jgi:hypothetical protein